MNAVKAVAFDLFNTLITVEPDALQVALARLVASLAQNKLKVDEQAFASAHRQAALDHVAKTRIDGRETHNRFWISAALAALGLKVAPSDRRIAEAVEAYFSAFLELSRRIPGSRRLLKTLRPDYRLGLLSNFTHGPAARGVLELLGLGTLFDLVVISGDLGYRKPHRRAFEALSRGFQLDPGAIVFVGDDPECDVHGARNAGLQPVWTTYVRDRNIPFAPGLPAQPSDPIDGAIPRITAWNQLTEYLEQRRISNIQ